MLIWDEFCDRTEADEWADNVRTGIVAALKTWAEVRAHVTVVLRHDESATVREAYIEALGRRAGVKMAWEIPAPETATISNPTFGTF